MVLPDLLPVPPWSAPCRGTVRLPGSKSLTNRALVLAALAPRRTLLEEALFSRDTLLLSSALQALGFRVQADEAARRFVVEGAGGTIPAPEARLFVGNAGTAARFLTALVCLHPRGTYHFDGDPEMRQRPMRGLIEALAGLGARFTCHGDPYCFPFTVQTSGLPRGDWSVDARSSSQMLSALLMVAPFASGPVRLQAERVRPAFVSMTAALMRIFGWAVEGSPERGFSVAGTNPVAAPPPSLPIEPDATAASYFLALPLVTGGSVHLPGLHQDMLQGDLAFAEVLRTFGLQIQTTADGWTAAAPPSPRSPRNTRFSFESFSDTFLTLAAIAPLLDGPVTLAGIGHTRHQESDRPRAMALGLQAAGARVEEAAGQLTVHPFPQAVPPPAPAPVIETFQDHRVAMSFSLLGCRDRRGDGQPWLVLRDPACCAKTYPGFFRDLHELYQVSHDKTGS